MISIFLTCLITVFSTSFVWAHNLELEIDPVELKSVEAHGIILKSKDVKGSPWPELSYYATINVSPLEAVGIFAAYDAQKDYVPNFLKSKPIKHVSATEVHTEYEMHMPFPIPNAHYVHGAKIFKHQDGYEVQWYLVKSSSTLEVKGSAYFQNYNGKTLMRYRSFIRPNSIFGSLAKNSMLKDALISIKTIISFVEKSKLENPAFVLKYSDYITRALNGEFVYQTIINQK